MFWWWWPSTGSARRWMDTVNAVRDLRSREVRIRSLAQSEAAWVTYLAAEPDTAEAVIGDILTTFMAWPAEQEIQAVSRRTKAGLERARADGKTLGPPPRVDGDQVEAMARLRREGQSLRSHRQDLRGYPAPRCSGGCRKSRARAKQGIRGPETPESTAAGSSERDVVGGSGSRLAGAKNLQSRRRRHEQQPTAGTVQTREEAIQA